MRAITAAIVIALAAAGAGATAGAQPAPALVTGTPRHLTVTRGIPFSSVVATFTDTAPGAVRDTAAFVDRAYTDLLGRPADDGGLAYWTLRTDSLADHSVLPTTLVSTSEWAARTVTLLYEDPAYLDRTPEADEVSYWAGAVVGGMSVSAMRALFLGSAEFVEAHGGTADPAAVVDALYRAALGRPADDEGGAYYTDLLANGTSATVIAAQLLLSPEGLAHLVGQRWQELLGRAPTSAEQAAWVSLVAAPDGEQSLIAALVATDEYFLRIPSDYTATLAWGSEAAAPASLRRADDGVVEVLGAHALMADGNDIPATVTVTRTGSGPVTIPSTVDVVGSRNERYLGGLYADVLGRPIDDGGRIFWLPRVATGGAGGRAVAVSAVLESPEWADRVVGDLYEDKTYLDRTADGSEVAFWAGLVQAGLSLDGLRANLLGSGEFYDAHGGTDKGFVDGLYLALLDRPFDPGGEGYFVSLLADDTTAEVATIMLESAEARLVLAGSIYSAVLHRAPTPAEASVLASAITAGLTDQGATALLITGLEYFDRFPIAAGA